MLNLKFRSYIFLPFFDISSIFFCVNDGSEFKVFKRSSHSSTTMPLIPSWIISRFPPTELHMTGSPIWVASIREIGNPSCRENNIMKSHSCMSSGMSSLNPNTLNCSSPQQRVFNSSYFGPVPAKII